MLKISYFHEHTNVLIYLFYTIVLLRQKCSNANTSLFNFVRKYDFNLKTLHLVVVAGVEKYTFQHYH